MPTTLTLIALTLALPWTRIGWQGGGHAMTHLIHRCHGCPCLHQLCLHLQDNGAKDDGRVNTQGHHANIRNQEEVGQHDPIGVKQKKRKKNQQRGGNVTASVPADSYARTAAAAASV